MKIEASLISYYLYKFIFKYFFEIKNFKRKHKYFKQLEFDDSLFLKDFTWIKMNFGGSLLLRNPISILLEFAVYV